MPPGAAEALVPLVPVTSTVGAFALGMAAGAIMAAAAYALVGYGWAWQRGFEAYHAGLERPARGDEDDQLRAEPWARSR